MDAKWLFVLSVACFVPASAWWSGNEEPPKEENRPALLLGKKPQETQTAQDGSPWHLVNKVVPEIKLDSLNPGNLVPEGVSNMARDVKEAAKEKARRELCEIIKTCFKSMMWPWG